MYSSKVSEGDKFRASVAMIAVLIDQIGHFEVAKLVAEEMLLNPTGRERRLAAKWCQRLGSLAARDVHPDIGEEKEKAAAIQLFAEHLSASHDPHRSFRVAVQCQDIDIPHNHTPHNIGEATGNLYFLDEFVEMVDNNTILPRDGFIGSMTGIDEFNWEYPGANVVHAANPETAVVEWCNK